MPKLPSSSNVRLFVVFSFKWQLGDGGIEEKFQAEHVAYGEITLPLVRLCFIHSVCSQRL